MGFGLFGFAGFFLAQLFAQRALHPDWQKRLRLFVPFMAGTMGLALSNTNAVWQALRGTDTAFIRTPKYGVAPDKGWWQSRYAIAEVPPIVWGELGLALYSTAGLGVTIALGEWAAIPFQALFALGFLLVTASSLRQVFAVRQTPTVSTPASSTAPFPKERSSLWTAP